MRIDELKNKILQMAIQGQLVEQDENDESASVLLERITAEKEKMITEKKINKSKVVPEVSKEEVPFNLPKGWVWCRLGQVSLQITDGTHKTPHYVEQGIPFLSIKNVSNGYIDLTDVKYITEEEHIELIKRCYPKEGDILFCRIGTLGKFKVIDIKQEFSIFVSLGLIKLATGIDSKYMEYLLNSPYLYEQYYKIKVDGSHTSKLNLVDMPNVIITLPPLQEQKRIVAKVESLFSLIDQLNDNKEAMLNSIADTRNKILQLAIQGKLVEQNEDDEPASVLLKKIKEEKEQMIKEGKIKKEKPLPEISDEEKDFEIPDGWTWCRLGDIGQIIGGGTPSSTNPEYYAEKGIHWLTPADLRGHKDKYVTHGNRDISNLGLENSSAQLLPQGSVLFSSRAPIGYVAIAGRELCTNQGFKSVVPVEMEMNEYIYYFLKYNTPKIQEMASGTTFKEISGSGMQSVVMPLPPLTEQQRIVHKIDELMSYINQLENIVLAIE